ncbi:uncharacterized protein LOC124149473 [Haliotis rufescens]|uniref:uncharacterized protein LOC124149473 n=1 Tax=Haliotis rufescens TaxID=6454 RepID=UPI00201F6166|nr:uncharacterized protein LOC124149473 [Haliotis rufescens]
MICSVVDSYHRWACLRSRCRCPYARFLAVCRMWYSFVLSFLWVAFITSVKAMTLKPRASLTDVANVQLISADDGHRFRRSADSDLPINLHFRVSSRGNDVNLRLRRSLTNQASDIQVYVIRENSVVKEDLPPIESAASYLDKVLGASIMVRKHRDGNFTLEGTYYDTSGQVYISHINGPKYAVHQIAHINYGNDFVINAESNVRSSHTTSARMKRRSVDEYTIEILFCADYKDYSSWENHFHNRTLAHSEMRLYYAFIAQSMSVRYASVTDVDPRIKINILVTGLLILDTPEKSYWTENEASQSGTVEVKPALRSFKDWLQYQDNLPPSDHWMLFSGYDLTSSGSRIVAGLATLAGMCTSASVSIIEQDYSASVGATAAHELGHSLSAVHDGTLMARGCTAADNYIMSSKLINPTNNATASRPWEFSSCSVAAFRNYLARVYCARETGKTVSPVTTKLVPGQVYSSDIQCKLALGNQSYFGRGIQYDRGFDSMCRAMYCAIPGRPRYFQKSFPMEKTTCGDGKWCIKGRCVVDPEAPRTPENCPQGDDADEDCQLSDCPFLTEKGRISYCCATCGVKPELILHTMPPNTTPTTPMTTTISTTAVMSSPPSGDGQDAAENSGHDTIGPESSTNTKDSSDTVLSGDSESSDNGLSSDVSTDSDQVSDMTPSPIKERPGSVGPGLLGMIHGMFSRFRNMFGGPSRGSISYRSYPHNTKTNSSVGVATVDTSASSTTTPKRGNWFTRMFGNRNVSGDHKTKGKFISVSPRQGDNGGYITSVLNRPGSGFFSSLLNPTSGNSRSSNPAPIIDGFSRFFSIGARARGNASNEEKNTLSSVPHIESSRRNTASITPVSTIPVVRGGGISRYSNNNGRLSPRWRSRKVIRVSTPRSTNSGFSTITLSRPGASESFCVSCSSSWTAKQREITQQERKGRQSPPWSSRYGVYRNISWLSRNAIREIATSNTNSDAFRVLQPVPGIFIGK